MVILETAVIGAAGYGLYRGGDAAVRKGKQTTKEIQREKARKSQRGEFQSKVKTRQERIRELVNLKDNKGKSTTASASSSTNTNTTTALTSQRGGIGGASGGVPEWASDSAPTAASSSTTNVDDRHQSVMEKLRQSRSQEATKAKGPGAKLKGLFGGKRK